MSATAQRPHVGNPRRFTRLVEVYSRTVASDGGEASETWLLIGRVWCEVVPLRGQEVLVATQLYPAATHKLSCWWTPLITATSKFIVGGRTLYCLEPPRSVNGEDRELEVFVGESP
jgi:head-tail adaptor